MIKICRSVQNVLSKAVVLYEGKKIQVKTENQILSETTRTNEVQFSTVFSFKYIRRDPRLRKGK